MDTFEVHVNESFEGLQVDEGVARVDQGEMGAISKVIEDIMVPIPFIPDNVDGKVDFSNDKFQVRLKEIDDELSRFDSLESGDPLQEIRLPAETRNTLPHLPLAQFEEHQINHVMVNQQFAMGSKGSCASPSGQTRGRK